MTITGPLDDYTDQLKRAAHDLFTRARARAMSDIVERLRQVQGDNEDAREAADTIERLRVALEPFARNVDAVSLSATLGHITREDLWRARAALERKP